MTRNAAWVTVLLLILMSGLSHGMLTRRWQGGLDVRAATDKLAQVPLIVGEWDGRSQVMGDREQEVGRIDGYLLRQYVNRSNGAAVQVLVVCGRPGPIAAHTPEVCYRGAGYEPTAEPAPHALALGEKGPTARLWTALFRRESPTGTDRLRIFWTWTADGAYLAPQTPRLEFAAQPVLYKIYVVRDVAGPEGPIDQDPAVEFMRVFLSELHQSLF